MKTLQEILNSSFESRLSWSLLEIEESLQVIGENFSTKVKELFKFEEDNNLDHCSVIDVYELENEIWRLVKDTYPEVNRPSYHMEIILQMSELEKKAYEKKVEYAKAHFASRAIEMKVRCFKAIDSAISSVEQELN